MKVYFFQGIFVLPKFLVKTLPQKIDLTPIYFYNIPMYEIELKAHIYDKDKTESLINGFADYIGSTNKEDTYYHRKNGIFKKHTTCRIRHEEHVLKDGSIKVQDVFTHKEKQRKKDENGAVYEVNQENETTLSDRSGMERFLLASGFEPAYTKLKIVKEWNFSTEYGTAHLELCTIPPIGDFLEIEIVTGTSESEAKIRELLKELIIKSGASLNDIEERYYSELLQLADKKK